jgi:hypothetical protein
MSWDIFVQDLPKDAKEISDIPNDFRPSSIGSRSQVIAKIKEVVPCANFSDTSWGLLDGDGWSIEINMGAEEECNGFAFHVRGGDEAAGVVAAILDHLRLRAIDAQSGRFFVAGADALASLANWREYRDRVLQENG